MYYRLKQEFRLRGWEKLPYALINAQSGKPAFISEKEMNALMLCNGKIDCSLTLIPETYRELVRQFEQAGIVESCGAGEEISPVQEYHLYPCRYIRTAHWSITGRCNYRCRHCYMSAPDAKYGELSHETVMRIVDELAECGIMNVTITGGEPLVRNDFLEIVDALLEKEIRIRTIYSNGMLVTEPLLKELDKRKIHPEFNMSFDGVGWHDWLRGIPGAEKAADRAFRLCRDLGFPTGAEMCLHDRNKETLRQSINYLSSVGCKTLKTNPISNVGAWLNTGLGETISYDELYQLYLDYIPHYYEDGMPLSLQLGGFFTADPRHPEDYTVPMYHHAFITSKAQKVLDHNPECRECPYKQWCLGGCRASGLESSAQTDLYHRDEAVCAMYFGGWAGKLIDLMETLHPEIQCAARQDTQFRETLRGK